MRSARNSNSGYDGARSNSMQVNSASGPGNKAPSIPGFPESLDFQTMCMDEKNGRRLSDRDRRPEGKGFDLILPATSPQSQAYLWLREPSELG